jgi:hypothetical protein
MSMSIKALPLQVLTFKSSGKWYAEGQMTMTQLEYFELTRTRLLLMNEGKCPGLSGPGAEFHIVLIPKDDTMFPRMFPSTGT